ncbi:MAG: hydrogenase maturation protease [Actinobacteria bacterium]|nr:hydrogenase maturation protease [Actinomycetota bacterium]
MHKLIILGVGNLLLSDEGAGIHTVEILKQKVRHKSIEIIDGATLGLDLFGLFDDAQKIWIVDCVKGGGEPGSVYKFGLESVKKKIPDLKLSMHDFNIIDVIELAKALGKDIPEITFYGIEPKTLEWGDKPSAEVRSGIEKAVQMIIDDLKSEFGEEVILER